MARKLEHDRETVLDAINGTGFWAPREDGKIASSFGNVTKIAQRLGVSRNTVYAYMERWATVKEAIDESRQTLCDIVENKMAEKMIGGDTTMIIFFAKTQMKNRGYVERHQIQNTNLDLTELTTEQLDRIAKGEDVYHVLSTTSGG